MEYHKVIDSNRYPLLQMQLERGFLRDQLSEIRCLLKLPQKRLPSGCNCAAASLLFNLISGISVCFFDASLEKFNSDRGRGQALSHLLKRYYPWNEEPLEIPQDRAINALYKSLRNPLTHCLGIYKASVPDRIYISKIRLTSIQIARLESPLRRPKSLPPTLSDMVPLRLLKVGVSLILAIPSLYWGVNRLLYKLLNDASQSDRTEQFFRDLSSQYHATFSASLGLAKD